MAAARIGAARRRPSIGALLAVVVLLPTAGMIILAGSTASDRLEERRVASHVRREAEVLGDLMEWRAALNDEWVLTAAVRSAGAYGLRPSDLEFILGFDVVERLDQARLAVDDAAAGAAQADLASLVESHDVARAMVDGNASVSDDEVNDRFWDLTDALEARWQDRLDELRGMVARSDSNRRPGDLFRRLDALQGAFRALEATMDRGDLAHLMLTGTAGPGAPAALLEANGRFDAVTARFDQVLGPRGREAWSTWQRSSSTRVAEQMIDGLLARFVDGEEPTAGMPLAAYGAALNDGIRWLDGATALITAASVDLAHLAEQRHDDAHRSLVVVIAAAAAVALAAVGAVVLLTRSVVRPLRQLASFAHGVADGDFDRSAPDPRGPREVARTTAAMADMAATVSAVEDFVIRLAGAPGSADLDAPLPGRMGRALQATVDQLRRSMQQADEHRRRLEVVASSDGLTGLLNRGAALEAIELGLRQATAARQTFAVLFVDLDGLKEINDTHGHDVGDEAIRRTADALRSSTRRTDVVGRIGGDEFLVALGGDDGEAEAARVAERIRRTVAEHPLDLAGRAMPLRCSIGVAVANPDDSAETVVRHADRALYDAKARGRNRICWFHASEEGTVC